MKVFIQSQSGEDGPFSPPELRRLFEQGKILGHQRCRVDGSIETKLLTEQFPEFAEAQMDPEEDAREKRRAQRRSKRIRNMVGGALLFVAGLICLFGIRPWKAFIMVISGFVIFVNGCLQNPDGHRKGREGRNRWDGSRRMEAERSGPRTYDY
jgi:hypothetical protein